MTATVTVSNVGPIAKPVSIPVDPEGGIVILRGRNGAGKTQALNAVQTLLSGNGTLNKRQGAEAPAEVSGFGATVRFSNRTTHTGELEVVSLEDRLSIADLVDPKLKDPAAADARRIKSILSLAGTKADFKLFAGLLAGNAMVQCTQKATREAGDIVDMAARVKADLHEAARQYEARADQAQGAATAARAAIEGIDLQGEADESKLRSALEASQASLIRMQEQQKAATLAQQARARAEAQLDKAIDEYTGPATADAIAAYNSASAALAEAMAATEKARKSLQLAERAEERASDALRESAGNAMAAKAHDQLIAQFRAALNANTVEGPTAKDMKAAEKALGAAHAAVMNGVKIRDAQRKQTELDGYQKQEQQHRNGADALRTAAKGVDDVLSRAVAGQGLRVKDGRLVTTTKRGETFFNDLSAGERWKIALDVAIDAVGERGLIPLAQEAWEGLDPVNRRLIADHVRGRKVTVITAQCDAGELRAEPFEAK